MSYGRPASTLAWASWAGAAAYTRPDSTAADAEFAEPTPVEARLAAASMLQQPAASARAVPAAQAQILAHMLGAPAAVALLATWGHVRAPNVLRSPAVLAAANLAQIMAPRVLGAPRVTASTVRAALVQAPALLLTPRAIAATDYSGLVDPAAAVRYKAHFDTPGGVVVLPISSWQATLQTAVQSYVQCVVPGVMDHVATLEDATEFAIYRHGSTIGGDAVEQMMALAPISYVQFAQGTSNFSAVVNGYATAFAPQLTPDAAFDRTLHGVRSVFSGAGGYRVRCAVDWLLRPGLRAWLSETESFVAGYVSFYVGPADAYMDVGQGSEA